MAKKPSSEQVANKLLSSGFGSRPTPAPAGSTQVSPTAVQVPLGAIPMSLTLDQVMPSKIDPRKKKNPQYDEIKESIRARGLDHMPVVTRVEGDELYRIRDGGNTRLKILKELWTETRDERYYRLNVLFKPYDGDIRSLAGHMAENDMRGGLSLIERAIGLEDLRKLYLRADNIEEISQRELSRRLKEDGYPVSNSTISRMQDVVRYLLPAIPDLLYSGLGIDSAVKLIALRKSCSAVWDRRISPTSIEVFEEIFIQALGGFEDFNFQRMQDELIGQMSEALEVDYALLSLDIQEESDKSRNSSRELPAQIQPAGSPGVEVLENLVDDPQGGGAAGQKNELPEPENKEEKKGTAGTPTKPKSPGAPQKAAQPQPELSIWPIADGSDEVSLRSEIVFLVRGISSEISAEQMIVESQEGLGFSLDESAAIKLVSSKAATTLAVFRELIQLYNRAKPSSQESEESADSDLFSAPLGLLLMDKPADVSEGQTSSCGRLSDSGVIKLFRVIRLARRLIDLECDYRQE